jgi:ATP-dependent helicase/nuclease subunit B
MILTKHSSEAVNFDRLAEEKINNGKINELLLIVPTNRKIRFLKKEIVASSPGKTTGAINLETLGTFCPRIVFDDSYSNKIISDAAARVLLKQAFGQTKLKYFSLYKADIPDGTLDRVRNVISEYKKHGMSWELLLNEAEKLETSEKIKAIDIAEVYRVYNGKFAELGVMETGDIYSAINALPPGEFEARFRKWYPDVNLILIDGFDEFTSPETNIINLLAQIKGCPLFLRFDYFQSNSAIFSHLDGSYDKFLEKGFEKREDLSFYPRKEFREAVRSSLFKSYNTKQKAAFENSISIIQAETRQKEIELIAKEIKELIINKKTEPHRICVVFNLVQQYSPIVRDIFGLNKIPFNLTDRFPLSSFQPVIELISFLETLENDFYHKDLFRVLGGSLFAEDEINSSNLLQTAVGLKLVAGYDTWMSRINDAAELLDRDISENNAGLKKLNLKKAAADLRKLKSRLEPFNKDLTPGDFLKNLKALVHERSLPLKLIRGPEERKEENLKSLETLLETVRELCGLFIIEYGPEKKFPLGFFLSNIRTALKSARFNIKEKSNYGALVTNLDEIRGLDFDYLFIAGLTDGDLPTRYSPEIFFSGTFVKSDLRHLTEERYHFYQSLCSWEKGLYLSFAEKDRKKELVKSNFLTEFQQLFKVKNLTGEDFKNKLYNREETLRAAGNIAAGAKYKIVPEAGLSEAEIKKDIDFALKRVENNGEGFEGNGYIYSRLSEEEKKRLAERKSKPYSITQLETYAKCPFKFFIERVLNLNEIEEPTEDVEAFEMGNLLHDILYEFYKTAIEKGLSITGGTETDSLKALNLLFEIAERKVNDSGFHSPFSFYEKERILGIDGNKNESVLYKFYLEEKERNPEFIPSYFETGFGYDNDSDSAVSNFKIEDVKIRGKIDRIDVDHTNKKYKIADYKLNGKKPNESALLRGVSLQLPLYMLAAKELLEEKTGEAYEPASAEIYSLKPGKDFGSKPVLPKNSRKDYDSSDAEKRELLAAYNNELIENCKEKITGFVRLISTGHFNVSPHEDRNELVCNYCGHSSICRVEEIRNG